MKQTEANQIIRDALWCVQKVRSNASEMLGESSQMVNIKKSLYPYIFDEDKTVIKPLLKLVERIDGGGHVSGMEFYNIMTIINRWGDMIDMQYMVSYEKHFPKPNATWVVEGFDGDE